MKRLVRGVFEAVGFIALMLTPFGWFIVFKVIHDWAYDEETE